MAREVLDLAGQAVRIGITTDEIDELVHEETVKRGGYPSPLNYCGFPKSVCTSINEIICHGIPSTSTKLQEGDLINIDVTCFYNGFHGDCRYGSTVCSSFGVVSFLEVTAAILPVILGALIFRVFLCRAEFHFTCLQRNVLCW